MEKQTSMDFVTLYHDENIKVQVIKGEKKVTITLENGAYLQITPEKGGWEILACPEEFRSSALAFMPHTENTAFLCFPRSL